jgi:hypothetical protein
MRNSFKELEELEMQNVSMPSDAIKNGITSDIGILKFISTIVEMYFPKLADLFIGLSGGESTDKNKKPNRYPDLN